MKKLKILPLTIYEFEAPDAVFDETLNFVNSIDWTKLNSRDAEPYYGITTGSGLQRNKDLKLFTEWSSEKVNELKEYEKLFCEKLTPVNMWVNCSFKDQWHHRHYHPLSYLSSIFYITGDSGDTWFSRPSEYFNEVIRIKDQDNFEVIYKHKIKPKTLIVFPSHLNHSVSENKSFLPRTTISTNYLPSGRVGGGLSMGYNCEIVSKD